MFTVSALIANHKATYEHNLGVIFNDLLHTTARLMLEAKAKEPRRAVAKVIKHTLKMKVDKPTVAKIILPIHIKEFTRNARQCHLLKTLRDNNVPEAAAQAAVGEVYDP
eukprot:8421214-Heterocapsa_arctica.AAC.1